MVPEPFTTGGNPLYLEFCAVTGDSRYPRHFTPIVAPEPSVKWVARAGHSMVGRTGTHMVLQALMWDSCDEIEGLKPSQSRLGIPRWCPPFSPLLASIKHQFHVPTCGVNV
jgi:hypothetical protein